MWDGFLPSCWTMGLSTGSQVRLHSELVIQPHKQSRAQIGGGAICIMNVGFQRSDVVGCALNDFSCLFKMQLKNSLC